MAGVAALVLSLRPDLTWTQVKDVLARCCQRIDPRGGAYGRGGRSPYYGHGRVDAERALRLARDA